MVKKSQNPKKSNDQQKNISTKEKQMVTRSNQHLLQPSDYVRNQQNIMRDTRAALRRFGYETRRLSDLTAVELFTRKFGEHDIDNVYRQLRMNASDLRPQARRLGWTSRHGNLITLDRYIRSANMRGSQLIHRLRSSNDERIRRNINSDLSSGDIESIRRGFRDAMNARRVSPSDEAIDRALSYMGAQSNKVRIMVEDADGAVYGMTATPTNFPLIRYLIQTRRREEDSPILSSEINDLTESEKDAIKYRGYVTDVSIEVVNEHSVLSLISLDEGRKSNKDNGYFPFMHRIKHIDLSRLQIWGSHGGKEDEYDRKEFSKIHCLIFAITQALKEKEDIEDAERERIMNKITGIHSCLSGDISHVSTTVIKKLCDLYEIQIQINTITTTTDAKWRIQPKPIIYGNKKYPRLKLASWKNHLFTNEKAFDISTWYMNNYSSDLPVEAVQWTEKGKRKTKDYKPKTPIEIALAIQRRESELLTPIMLSENTPLLKPELTLDVMINEQKPHHKEEEEGEEEEEEKERKKGPKKITKLCHYALDCEADVSTREFEGVHKAIMIGFKTPLGDYRRVIADVYSHLDAQGNMIKDSEGNYVWEKALMKDLENEIMNAHKETVKHYHRGLDKKQKKRMKVKPIIWAHNLGYDTRLLSLFGKVQEDVEKTGTLYRRKYLLEAVESKDKTWQLNVEFRCSHKHFGCSLAKLPEMFGFDWEMNKGDGINYNYHTIWNIRDETDKLKDHKTYAKDWTDKLAKFKAMETNPNTRGLTLWERKQKIKLQAKIDAIEDFTNENPDATTSDFYQHYLEYDCKVLKKALDEYSIEMRQIVGFDPLTKLTISSVGDQYVESEGAYTEVYKMCGNLRKYCQQAVRGGRVWCNDDKTIQGQELGSKQHRIEDFDAVSLYPSAMRRLGVDGYGYPKGKALRLRDLNKRLSYGRVLPTRLEDRDNQCLKKASYYIIQIELKKIRKNDTAVPIISYKDDDGIVQWVNELKDDKPVRIFLDRFAFEDAIKYCAIDYEIIDGVYWNKGFNSKIADIAQKLHLDRCKHKKTNKPLANMIKLLMNSLYGKTIPKACEHRTVWKSTKEEADKYIKAHSAIIKDFVKIGTSYKIREHTIDMDYSKPHCGSSILSMSKRIMNEVFHCFKKAKSRVYITDTDSIHCDQDKIKKVEKHYKKIYNKTLVGKDLGNFHVDFELKDCIDVSSICHIPIGKKLYMDIIEGDEVKNGKKTGEKRYGMHCRAKGLTEDSLDWEMHKVILRGQAKDEYEAAKCMYRRIADKNTPIKFTLNNGDCVSFEKTSNGAIKTRPTGTFTRTVNRPPKIPKQQ